VTIIVWLSIVTIRMSDWADLMQRRRDNSHQGQDCFSGIVAMAW
jgi:hypothetical protein